MGSPIPNAKPFTKGDPRINRKGRPKSFDKLRSLAQQIAHETATSKGEPVIINGQKVTVTEAILRQWAMSKDPRLQMYFMEVAYGKPPQTIDVGNKDGEPFKVQNDTLTDEERTARLAAIFDKARARRDRPATDQPSEYEELPD